MFSTLEFGLASNNITWQTGSELNATFPYPASIEVNKAINKKIVVYWNKNFGINSIFGMREMN